MTTRLKTIQFSIHSSTISDNVLTPLPQITMYIPEFSGVVTFRSVVIELSADEVNGSAVGNINTRRISVSVGGAGATLYANTNVHTASGLLISEFFAADATAHFVANWVSGTTKTLVSVLIDGAAAVTAWGVNVTVYITYEYDDTQPTQIKTVLIPLDTTVAATPANKPITPQAIIPALDTELPEASKLYRDRFIVFQGNYSATADLSLSMEIDTLGVYTTTAIEGTTAAHRWTKFVYKTPAFTTNVTHGFHFWAQSVATSFYHPQAWLVVTYEFDATQNNDVFVSLILPMELSSPMGGVTSSDYQRAVRELRIQEPGSITTKQIAFFVFWEQAAAIAGLQMRVGTGGFIAYSDAASVLCGSNGAMCRNDAAFTLQRGVNSLNFDIYRTDTADLGWNLSGFWIVNYTASKPSQGYGAANHTIFWNLGATFDGTANILRTISATAIIIPESDYFLIAVGINYRYITNITGTAAGVVVLAEKTTGEGGLEWLSVYTDVGHTDPETGLRQCWAQTRSIFRRFPADADNSRLDIETARRWRTVLGNAASSFDYLDLVLTYHTITYTVSGTISGSDGGNIEIQLQRVSDNEIVLETSRVGDGAYSFTWYDNVDEVRVLAYESTTKKGLSKQGVPATDFDISLSSGGGETFTGSLLNRGLN